MSNLPQKICITGSSGGIGQELMKLISTLPALQYCQILQIRRQEHGDLIEDIQQICQTIQEFEPDIMIHLAGSNEFNHAELQKYTSMLDLNLKAPMLITQSLLPQMKRQKKGQFIFVGSMLGLIPLPYYTGYVATKAGLKAYCDSLRREVKHFDINVTHIAPRAVNTSMNDASVKKLHQKTGVKSDSPQLIAQTIVNAILKPKSEIRIGFPERFFAIIQSLFPKMVDNGLKKNNQVSQDILSQALKK